MTVSLLWWLSEHLPQQPQPYLSLVNNRDHELGREKERTELFNASIMGNCLVLHHSRLFLLRIFWITLWWQTDVCRYIQADESLIFSPSLSDNRQQARRNAIGVDGWYALFWERTNLGAKEQNIWKILATGGSMVEWSIVWYLIMSMATIQVAWSDATGRVSAYHLRRILYSETVQMSFQARHFEPHFILG